MCVCRCVAVYACVNVCMCVCVSVGVWGGDEATPEGRHTSVGQVGNGMDGGLAAVTLMAPLDTLRHSCLPPPPHPLFSHHQLTSLDSDEIHVHEPVTKGRSKISKFFKLYKDLHGLKLQCKELYLAFKKIVKSSISTVCYICITEKICR